MNRRFKMTDKSPPSEAHRSKMSDQITPPEAATLTETLSKLTLMLDRHYQQTAIAQVDFPKFNYRTSFTEWAAYFAKLATVKLGLSESAMIEEATRQLDGFIGQVAAHVAEREPNDWKKFVMTVDQHLGARNQTASTRRRTLRQVEVNDQDVDLYIFNKLKTVQDEFPDAGTTVHLYQILEGLREDYFAKLYPKVKDGEIKTVNDLIVEANAIKRKCLHFVSLKQWEPDTRPLNCLVENNFYAHPAQKKVQFDPHNLPVKEAVQFDKEFSQLQNPLNYHQGQFDPHKAAYNRMQQPYGQKNSQKTRHPNALPYQNLPAITAPPTQQPQQQPQTANNNQQQPAVSLLTRVHEQNPVPLDPAEPSWKKIWRENFANDPKPAQATSQHMSLMVQPENRRKRQTSHEKRRVRRVKGVSSKHQARVLAKFANQQRAIGQSPCSSRPTSESEYDSEDEKQNYHLKRTIGMSSVSSRPTSSEEGASTGYSSDTDEESSADDRRSKSRIRKVRELLYNNRFSSESEESDSEGSYFSGFQQIAEVTDSENFDSDEDEQSLATVSEYSEPEQTDSDQEEESDGSEAVSEYEVVVKEKVAPLVQTFLMINGTPCRGIIDTGSTSTFVAQRTIEKIGIAFYRTKAPRFVGLDSSGVGRPEYEAQLKLQMPTTQKQQLHITTPAYVLKDLCRGDRIDIVIGRNVISQAQLNICHRTGHPLAFGRKHPELSLLAGPDDATPNPRSLQAQNKAAHISVPFKNTHVRIGRHLQEHDQQQVLAFVDQIEECLSTRPEDVGRVTIESHRIDTGNQEAIRCRPYAIKPHVRQEVYEQIQRLLENDIIEESRSPWAFPIVVVPKKDGSQRICIDYRKLNKITKRDAYPTGNIEHILAELRQAKFISSLDVRAGYYCVEVSEEDRPKTAFTTGNGLYQFKRMPFGLKNSPATFVRVMNKILQPVLNSGSVHLFLDDILLTTNTLEEHLDLLSIVCGLLKQYGLKLNTEKCMFALTELTFLGHRLGPEGVSPDPENTRAIIEMPPPHDRKTAQSFIGACSFYRKYIENFAKIAAPITNLFKKTEKFVWGPEQEQAFNYLKERLVEPPILALFDPTLRTELRCDASGTGLGSALVQFSDPADKIGHPVAFASRKLREVETRYSTSHIESTAVMFGISKFEPYLIGIEFRILTDNQALEFMNAKPNELSPKLARWLFRLQEFHYEIVYKPGKRNLDADVLSRLPVDSVPHPTHDEELNGDLETNRENREFAFLTIVSDRKKKRKRWYRSANSRRQEEVESSAQPEAEPTASTSNAHYPSINNSQYPTASGSQRRSAVSGQPIQHIMLHQAYHGLPGPRIRYTVEDIDDSDESVTGRENGERNALDHHHQSVQEYFGSPNQTFGEDWPPSPESARKTTTNTASSWSTINGNKNYSRREADKEPIGTTTGNGGYQRPQRPKIPTIVERVIALACPNNSTPEEKFKLQREQPKGKQTGEPDKPGASL